MRPVPAQCGQVSVECSSRRGPQPLARHLEQAEGRDAADLDARAVVAHRVLDLVLDLALVARLLHVDEVDHDQAGEVAQAHLAGDLLGRLDVGASAVSSMLRSLVERPELTSMATSASVGLMTM